MTKKVIHEDIRINKFISDSGFCSRREADKLVTDERVTINGELATLGSRVAEGDKVRIDGEPLQFVPMEQRDYKLRRYGASSRRAAQDVDAEENDRPQKRKSSRNSNPPTVSKSATGGRRSRAKERPEAATGKTGEKKSLPVQGKSTGRPASAMPNRGRAAASGKPREAVKRKK